MKVTTERGAIPWLEELQRRVERLEARTTAVSIGAWVVEVDDDGALVARNTSSGTTTVVAS